MFPDDSNGPASTCGDQNFSMRDYVLASRKKDISHNWPFPPKYLQMCMEHGISKVLPPFESHGLPRYPIHEGSLSLDPFQEEKVCASVIHNNFMTTIKMEGTDEHEKGTCMEEAIAYVSEQVCLLSLATDRNEHKDGFSADSSTKFEDNTVDSKMKGTRESMLDHELLESSSLCQGMRCRVSDMSERMVSSMLNLQEQNEVDVFVIHDKSVAGNGVNLGSTVADQSSELGHQVHLKARNPFASTNLSSGKRSGKTSRRRKGKPKKRTMADICARARASTLEDLDRVNGSNWANESSLMPYNSWDYRENLCAFDERRGSLSIFYESKLQVRRSMKKHPRDESEKDNYLLVKKRRIMVKKLKGSRKRNLSSLTTNDCKAG